MARFNGMLLLTEKQIQKIRSGNPVKIRREGKCITVGIKIADRRQLKIDNKIKKLKKKLKDLSRRNKTWK